MCDACDALTYEQYECCASGSCEVCRGTQGAVRSAVVREQHPNREAGDPR